MKLDVQSIVRDHWRTLTKGQSATASLTDFLTFLGLPLIAAIVAGQHGLELKIDAYNVSVTFFGIFIALLLNIQVAIFAIFQRKWTVSDDPIEAKIQQGVVDVRRQLLGELNANISYLVLVCCTALFVSLCAYVAEWKQGFVPAAIAFLYGHFLLTLLMVVKRSHAVFQQEYKRS